MREKLRHLTLRARLVLAGVAVVAVAAIVGAATGSFGGNAAGGLPNEGWAIVDIFGNTHHGHPAAELNACGWSPNDWSAIEVAHQGHRIRSSGGGKVTMTRTPDGVLELINSNQPGRVLRVVQFEEGLGAQCFAR